MLRDFRSGNRPFEVMDKVLHSAVRVRGVLSAIGTFYLKGNRESLCSKFLLENISYILYRFDLDKM